VYCAITSEGSPADDLGYLLAKHPGRVHRFDLSVGQATVFYPRADERVCTAGLLVEVDAIDLVRSRRFRATGELADHINDRGWAASSMLAVALGRVYHSGLTGACRERPDLVGQALPLTIQVPALPARDGADFVRALFEPLGWQVEAVPVPLVAGEEAWGESRYVELTMRGAQTVQSALQHLYVLLPVLDDAKHYWVGEAETDKLMRHAGDWLGSHPLRETIMQRYLAHQRRYVEDATARLLAADDADAEAAEGIASCQPPSLAVRRRAAIVAELVARRAWRVVDLGCGEGKLCGDLLGDARFTEVVGTDVSPAVLARAEQALGLDHMPQRQRDRLQLLQSSATYRDARLSGYDAVVLAEVVEHVDPDRHEALETCVFGAAAPRIVLVTTPNAEYNARYGLSGQALRHPDHRFEWTRAQFAAWAHGVADRFGYRVELRPVGPEDPGVGAPTQMAAFTRDGTED